MQLTRFLSPSRYAMCRKLFKHPLRTMLTLAFMRHYSRGYQLDLFSGKTISLELPYLSHWFWDHVLTPEAAPRLDGDLLHFRFGETEFELPLNDDTVSTATAIGQHLPGARSVSLHDGLIQFMLADQQIALRPGSMTDWFVAREILVNDEYSVGSLPSDLDVVVDCGANIGLFSSYVGQKVKRLILLEPVAENIRLAKRNLELAGVADKAAIEEAALGADSSGMLTLRVYKNAQGNNSALADHSDRFGESHEINVPTISIEDLFAKHHVDECDLFKCDIEGGEYDAFENVSLDVLARIRRIRMEYHLFEGAGLLPRFERLCTLLKEAGFRIAATPPFAPDGKPSECTYLAATRVPGEALVLPTDQSL